jgi:hypothetical protein
VDASVAVNLLTNVVKALVGEDARLTLTGGNIMPTSVVIGKDSKGKDVFDQANLFLRAWQRGQTYTAASGFAVEGSSTAVGAAVAVNLASSDVLAKLQGSGTVKGKTRVEAITSNEDEDHGLAMVTGASLDRYFEKMRGIMTKLNSFDNPPTGGMNAAIVNKLNGFAGPVFQKVGPVAQGLPVLPMLLKRLPFKMPATPTGGAPTDSAISDTGASKPQTQGDEQSINIAAAASVNVTEHATHAVIDGDFTTEAVELEAENRANFRTRATGATIVSPGAVNTNLISAAISVSVNGNTAVAELGGDVTAMGASDNEDGKVKVRATLTQNMDGRYRGLLAAQSVAGALGGQSGKVGVAGAVSVVVAQARAKAAILADAAVRGGAVDMLAYDKSKLAVRAGGIQAGGQTAGVGAAFALVYSENDLDVAIGDRARVTAASLSAKAQKAVVNSDDYEFPFSLKTLFTVNVPDDDPMNKGLINLNISDSNSGGEVGANSLEVNLSTDKVLQVLDMLNYLSSVNYYLEAIGGAIAAGAESTTAISGAMAMLFANSSTSATVGEDAVIRLAGDFELSAESETLTRLIGGSLAATNQNGVGLNIAAMDDRDEILATVGDRAKVEAANQTVKAKAKSDTMAITVAAAITTGSSGGAAIGGGLNVIVTGSKVHAAVGDDAHMIATGDVNITSKNISDLLLVSTSVGASTGTSVAAGGTFAAIVAGNSTKALVGADAVIDAAKNIVVRADSKENLINVLASLSGSSGNAGVAGTLGVLVSQSDTLASVGDRAVLTARDGGIQVLANGNVDQIVVMAAASGSASSAAVGATVNVGVFDHKVQAIIGKNARLIAQNVATGRNVVILAQGKDQTILVTIAGAAASGAGIAGTVTVVVGTTEIVAQVQDGTTVEAGDTVVIYADLDLGLYDVAGAVGISASSAGVGATLSTMVLNNKVAAELGAHARAIAHSSSTRIPPMETVDPGVRLPNRSQRRRGVVVGARSNARILMVSVSGSGGSSVGVSGVVNTLVAKNQVQAAVGNSAVVVAGYEGETGDGETGGDAEVAVEADDESDLYNLAGGVAVGGTAGVGATVVVMVYDKTVSATVGTGGTIRATGDVGIRAHSADEAYLLALSFGVAGSAAVSVGANAQVFMSRVQAAAGGAIDAKGDIDVQAQSDVTLVNIAIALAGSGTAAVTPVGVVTYFQGETLAKLEEDANLIATGAVNVGADSREFVTLDVLGVAVSGTASVSGAVSVLVSKAKTQALVLRGASVEAASMNVLALDDYQLIGAAAAVGASGTAGIAVTAVVSVLKNTVTAGIGYTEGENAPADAGVIKTKSGDVTVNAVSKRDVIDVAATVGGAQVGVGATVMVVVAGGKMPQDAHDTLMKGGSEGNTTFDPNGFAGDAFDHSGGEASGYKAEMSDLGSQLEGDGECQSETTIGTRDGDGSHFDGTSGYQSEDFEQEDFDDEGDSARGEDAEIDPGDNPDITAAGMVGPVVPTANPQDTIRAFIGRDVSVVSAGGIDVLADSLTNVDLVTATISVGAYAAVGAGVAVAVLFSNVDASVEDGAKLSAECDVTVRALSRSEVIEENGDEKEEERNKALTSGLGLGEALTRRTIRAISVTGSAALVGVSVSVAVVVLENVTRATMAGDVLKARSLTVESRSHYPLTLAATLAASGGAAAVNASVAVAAATGRVETAIKGNADIQNVPAITVATDILFDASTFAATLGVGGIAVNGGVALSINRLESDTYVGRGVAIGSALETLDVRTHSGTTAHARLLGVSVGAVSANIGAAVAIVNPVVRTIVGDAGEQNVEQGQIKAPNADIRIRNEVASDASSEVLSLAAGVAAVGGNILLVFNDTDATAGLIRKNVAASSIDVDASFDANAQSILASGAVGGLALGISVSYVGLFARNMALIDVTGVTVSAGNVAVNAGTMQDQNTSIAQATAIAGNIGAVSVGVNVAIADNATQNHAMILGDRAGALKATGAVEVLAYGKAIAEAEVEGLNVGGISVAASFAIAVLRSGQSAKIQSGNLQAAGLTVESHLNRAFTQYGQDVTQDADKDTARAVLKTGTGGLISAAANIAVAYGRSASEAIAAPYTLSLSGGNVRVGSYGNAGVKTYIYNISSPVDAVTAAAMVGAAFAQGEFTAELQIPAGGTVHAGSVNVETLYLSRALADVTPSAQGVKLSLASIKINAAIAVADSTARAALSGVNGVGGKLTTGALKVAADGDSYAQAKIVTPVLTAANVTVAANVIVAAVRSEQDSKISHVTVEMQNHGNVTADSKLNTRRTETAGAILGGMGSATVSLVGAKVNLALALADGRSRAELVSASIFNAGAIGIASSGNTVAHAKTSADNLFMGLASVGINVLKAKANGGFDAVADVTRATITASTLKVESTYTAQAITRGAVPSGGLSAELSAFSFDTNVAEATTGMTSETGLRGQGSVTLKGSLTVTANGTADAEATFPGTTLSVTGANFALNKVEAVVGGNQEAFVRDADLNARSASVKSMLNNGTAPRHGARAEIGYTTGTNAKLSLVDIEVNSALAKVAADAVASFGAGTAALEQSLTVQMLGNSFAEAKVNAASMTLALVDAAVTEVEAIAGGSFTAKIGDGDITAGSASVTATVVVDAKAESAQPNGKISLYSANTNKATADAASQVNAIAQGTGTITTDDELTLKGTTTATADARIAGTKLSASVARIGLSMVKAEVSAAQTAGVTGKNVQAGSVAIKASFNDGANKGATARIGRDDKGSADLAFASMDANTATALISGSSRALFASDSAVVTGKLSVGNNAKAYAKADVEAPQVDLSIAKAAIIMVNAEAKGTFEAGIHTNGSVKAGDVEVKNTYETRAIAEGGAPNVSVALVSGKVNLAEAWSTTVANAYLSGHGTIEALEGDGTNPTTGAITIENIGTGKATAKIEGTKVTVSGAKVEVNKVVAEVAAVQKAYVENATVKGVSLTVRSRFNKPENSTTTIVAADAQVGSNGSAKGVDISLASGKISKAGAYANATAEAYLDRATTDLSGALVVETLASTVARSKILNANAVSLFNVSLVETTADAGGSYASWIDTTESAIKANNVFVHTEYSADAEAKVSAAGSSVTLVSGDVNDAQTTTRVNASSEARGSGSLAAGILTVQTTGALKSVALAETVKLSVSAVRVAYNHAKASTDATQSASIATTGVMTVDGMVNVKSLVTSSMAKAKVGGSATEKTISLVAGGSNVAESHAKVVNTASITGGPAGGVLNAAGNVNVLSKVENSASEATAKDTLTVAVATMGSLKAVACTGETISADVTGIKIVSPHNVTIQAMGDTKALATGYAPGKFSAANASKSEIEAYVGDPEAPQKVTASLGDGAVLEIGEDLTVYAKNQGNAKAQLMQKDQYSLVESVKYTIPTSSHYDTAASIGNNVNVVAENISVKTEDSTVADSQIRSSQVTLVMNVDTMHGTNTITASNSVTVGRNANLFAHNDLTIRAESKADMTAITWADSNGGFIGDDELKAYNTLTRTVNVTIQTGAVLEADFGTLSVEADAGRNDRLYTYARIESTRFVALGEATASATATTSTAVDIHKGATLKNTFGHLIVRAIGSMNDMYAYAHVYNAGLGVNPHAEARQKLTLNTAVKVGVNGTGQGPAVLTGRHVEIRSMLDALKVKSKTYSRGRALGVNVETVSKVTANFTNLVTADAAKITGYDSLRMVADAGTSRPDKGYNLDPDAYSFAQGVGRAKAVANLNGSSDAKVEIGAGADLIGTGVEVDTLRYDGSNRRYPHTKRTGIASATDKREGVFNKTTSVAVDADAVFHIGDAAAGIIIDISERAGVRAVGLPKDSMAQISGERIMIGALSNNLPGTLRVKGALNGNTIYDQRFIGEVSITNRTGKDMQIAGATLENINYVAPKVTVSDGSSYTVATSDYTTPPVAVTNWQDGDVTVTGLIAAQMSTVTFTWTGETGGGLYSVDCVLGATEIYEDGRKTDGDARVASVFAKYLYVLNAGNIGRGKVEETDEVERFHAFIFDGGTMEVQTSGSSYAAFTPVELWMVSTLPTVDPHAAQSVVLNVGTVLAESVNDLLIHTGMRIFRLTDTNVVSIPVPGTLHYLTYTVSLAQDVTLNADAMKRYLLSVDPLDKTATYCLPNGTVIVTAEDGEVLSISEFVDGTEVYVALSDYGFNGDVVTLADGVALDVTTGALTIGAGYTYETLLSSVSAQWLLKMVDQGTFKFFYENENDLHSDVLLDPVSVEELTYWMTLGDNVYYWLKGYEAEKVDFLEEQTLYYLVVNTSDDTLQVFSAKYGEEPATATAADKMNYLYDSDGKPVVYKGKSWPKLYGMHLADDADRVLEAEGLEFTGFLGIPELTGYYNLTTGEWTYKHKDAADDTYAEIPNLTRLNDSTTYQIGPNTTLSIGVDVGGYVFQLKLDETSEVVPKPIMYLRNNPDGSITYIKSETSKTLVTYEGTVSYFNMNDSSPVSLYVAQAIETDSEGAPIEQNYYAVGFSTHTAEDIKGNPETNTPPRMIAIGFTGGSENVPLPGIVIKQVAIPYTSIQAYQMTDQLYVQKDGRKLVFLVKGKGIIGLPIIYMYKGTYDGTRFESDYMTVPDVSSPALTLKTGQDILLEQLTDNVAIDVFGRYFYKLSSETDAWRQATATTNNEVITISGTPQGSVSKVDLLKITHINGVMYYTIQYGPLKGTVVGSDGSVTSTNPDATTQHICYGKKNVVNLGQVRAEDVKITMEAVGTALIPVYPPADPANIIADRAEIVSDQGTIAEDDNPLTIAPYTPGVIPTLTFSTHTTRYTLTSNTHVQVDGDGNISIPYADVLTVDGALFDYTATGSITFKTFELTNGAELDLDAGEDVVGEYLHAYIDNFGDTTATIVAEGNITITRISLDDCNAVLTAGNDIAVPGTLTITDTDDDDVETVGFNAGNDIVVDLAADMQKADVGFTAQLGDIHFKSLVDIKNADVTFAAGGNATVDGAFSHKDSDTDIKAHDGDILFGNRLSASGGTLTASAVTGMLTVEERVDLTSAVVKLTSGTDMRFNSSVDSAGADITLDAGGNLTVDGAFSHKDSDTDIKAHDGDILFGNRLSVTDGTLTGKAMTGALTVQGRVDLTSTDVDLTSGTDMRFNSKVDSADAHLTLKTGGDLTFEDKLTSKKDAVTATVEGNLTFEDALTSTGSTVTATVEGDLTFADTLTSTEDVVKATVGGDTRLEKLTTMDRSAFTLVGQGSLTMEDADLAGGTFDANVADDIAFTIIESSENTLTLATRSGNILTTVLDGYIRFRDTDPSSDQRFTLSAGSDVMDAEQDVGNIGSKDHTVIVDTDDVLFIPAVNNYYIDSVELVGNGLFKGVRPELDIRTGVDEHGQMQTGDFLKHAVTDTVFVEIVSQGIAQRLTERMDRAEWSALINESTLAALMADGTITRKQLNLLLVDNVPGSALTYAAIRNLLKLGDKAPEEGMPSGYAQLAAALLPKLNSALLDREGVPTEQPAIADATLTRWLEAGVTRNLANVDDLAQAIEDTITEAELAAMIEQAWTMADYHAGKGEPPEDPEPRGFEIQVGEAVGGAYVENEGDITITQEKGTLTVAAVLSDRGDVVLTAQGGGIEGRAEEEINVLAKNVTLNAAQGVGADTPVKLEQRDNRVTLVANLIKPTDLDDAEVKAMGADGMPTTEAERELNPKVGWALEAIFDFDWLRVEYPDEATRLDVAAGGDVNLVENTGNTGLGVLTVGNGNFTLKTPGDVVDARGENDAGANLTVTGNARIDAGNGSLGSTKRPIDTDVNGTIFAITRGDINITDRGTLDLIADSENGQVNAAAVKDLNLSNSNRDKDLVVGPIQAGGTATIIGQGSIVAGDRLGHPAQVAAQTIDMTALNGHIGTEEEEFLVDTDAENGGTLAASGAYLNIREITGDLNLKKLQADTDAILTAEGAILDANGPAIDEAVQAQKDANAAAAVAVAAESNEQVKAERAEIQKGELELARAALAAAQQRADDAAQRVIDLNQELAAARQALAAANPADKKAVNELKKDIAALEKALAKARKSQARADQALAKAQAAEEAAKQQHGQAAADAALAAREAQRLREEADQLQNGADAAKQAALQAGTTVQVGDDLTLNAGGSIGEADHGLSARAGGAIDANLNGNMNLTGIGDVHLTETDVPGNISVATLGGTITGSGVLSGQSLDVSALGGDVGQKDNPLVAKVPLLNAQGTNVYIRNLTDTTVGNITAGGEAQIDVDGSIQGDGVTRPNITAGDLTLHADGDIGSKIQPLDTVVDALHGSGEDIFLDNHSPDLNVTGLKSDSLRIHTDGNITGRNIVTGNITIRADGNVGTKDTPMRFWADGRVRVTAGLDILNYINLYRGAGEESTAGGFLYADQTFHLTFMMRFDVTVGGEEKALYLAVGLNDQGQLILMGLFLGERETDQAFWLQVLTVMHDVLGVTKPGVFVVDGFGGFAEALQVKYGGSVVVDIAAPKAKADEPEEADPGRNVDKMLELLMAYTDGNEDVADAFEAFASKDMDEILGTAAMDEEMDGTDLLLACAKALDEMTASAAEGEESVWAPSLNSGYAMYHALAENGELMLVPVVDRGSAQAA